MTTAFVVVALVLAVLVGLMAGIFATLLWATRYVRGRDRVG